MQKKIKKSFTLVEILVVVAIIGLLATIVMVSLSGVGEKGNNARRIEDLRSVHTALISYYYKSTPYYFLADGDASVLLKDTAQDATGLASNYIQRIPTDPDPVDTDYVYKAYRNAADCTNTGTDFCKDFVLCANLEPGAANQKVFCCNKGGCKEGTAVNQKCDDLSACPAS